MVLDSFGWFWIVLAVVLGGFGSLKLLIWVILGRFGWFWVVLGVFLGGFGWFWIVLARFGLFWVVSLFRRARINIQTDSI